MQTEAEAPELRLLQTDDALGAEDAPLMDAARDIVVACAEMERLVAECDSAAAVYCDVVERAREYRASTYGPAVRAARAAGINDFKPVLKLGVRAVGPDRTLAKLLARLQQTRGEY